MHELLLKGCFPSKLGFWTGSLFHQIGISTLIPSTSVCKFQRALQYWKNLWRWKESTSEEPNPKGLICFTWPEQLHQQAAQYTDVPAFHFTLLSNIRSQNSIGKFQSNGKTYKTQYFLNADCQHLNFSTWFVTFTGTLTHIPKSTWLCYVMQCPKHGIIFFLELVFAEELCYWYQQPSFTSLLNQQSLSMVLFTNVVKYRQVQGIIYVNNISPLLCAQVFNCYELT